MKAPQKSLKDWGDQKWRTKSRKAVVKDRGALPPGKGNQGTKPSRVCRHDEGKAGREKSRKAVRCTAQGHSQENSGV